MADYQLTATHEPCTVIRTADGACIPNDPTNRDYAEYLQWLEDGGVPDPYLPPLDVKSLDMRTAAQILGVT